MIRPRPQSPRHPCLMEHMTTQEVRSHLHAGQRRVILSSGSIEQHGAHLPLDTDYVLAKALALRAAKRLPNTLVAPVIAIGCAEHHMAFSGTVSTGHDTFITYVEDAATSLIKHGFHEILFTSFHGGNFAPSSEAAERVQRKHPEVAIRTALDLQALFEVTNGVIREFFPDRTALDCHAGCVETSMMFYLDRHFVREQDIADGAVFTEIPPLHDIRAVSPNGVLGLVGGYSAAIGERLFEQLVAFMLRSWGYEELVG